MRSRPAFAKSPRKTKFRCSQHRPLARVLYRSVDIGAEIPSALYVAVAQVLTYVFQLKAAKSGLALMR